MRPPVDLPRLAEFSDGTTAGLRQLIAIFVEDSAMTAAELEAALVAGHCGERMEQLWQAGATQVLVKASSTPNIILEAVRTALVVRS